MLQELRDYWLPLILFVGTLLVAVVLLLLVAVMPWVSEPFRLSNRVLVLFAQDATVRRTALACAVGLVATAWVFFRPPASALARKSSAKKPKNDTMAGA